MGYSTSNRSVKKIQRILDKLIDLEPNAKLEIQTDDAKRLTYAIHEGFRTIKDNPTGFPDYVEIAERFRVRNKGSIVYIEPKAYLVGDIKELAEAIRSLVVPDVHGTLQIIGAIIKHKAPKLSFPNAQLEPTDVERLRKWCKDQNYEIIETEPLTIQKVNGEAHKA
jgi:hypothetical protein